MWTSPLVFYLLVNVVDVSCVILSRHRAGDCNVWCGVVGSGPSGLMLRGIVLG
jgi:hypothetical protein